MKSIYLQIQFFPLDSPPVAEASLVADSETGDLQWESSNPVLKKLLDAVLPTTEHNPEDGDRVLSLYHKADRLKLGEITLRYPPQSWQEEKDANAANSLAGVCF